MQTNYHDYIQLRPTPCLTIHMDGRAHQESPETQALLERYAIQSRLAQDRIVDAEVGRRRAEVGPTTRDPLQTQSHNIFYHHTAAPAPPRTITSHSHAHPLIQLCFLGGGGAASSRAHRTW